LNGHPSKRVEISKEKGVSEFELKGMGIWGGS
jgi:hypothetical protein